MIVDHNSNTDAWGKLYMHASLNTGAALRFLLNELKAQPEGIHGVLRYYVNGALDASMTNAKGRTVGKPRRFGDRCGYVNIFWSQLVTRQPGFNGEVSIMQSMSYLWPFQEALHQAMMRHETHTAPFKQV